MSEGLKTRNAISKEAADFIRPLGCGEHFFHLYAQVWPVHFCLCVEIEGAVGFDALRSALDQVRERHPILKARIVDDEQLGTAFYKSDAPIEIEATVIGKDGDWRPTVEHELRKPIGANALLRATALYGAETTAIVLTFHHAVADALSAVWILDDLLRALAGERLEALPFSPTVEDAILKVGSKTARSPQVDRSMSFAQEKLSATPMVSDGPRTHIATVEFSRDETARLIERCRANGTTVHGAICAAASRHVPASEPGTVRIVCPIDLRGQAGIRSGACGVYIGASFVDVPDAGTGSLWHDARQIIAGITQSRSPAAVLEFMQRISSEFPPTTRKEKLRAFLSEGQPSSLVVSNLGVLPIAERYGSHRVKAVWGPAMLTNFPEDRQVIGVSTFGGQLRIVHQSYVPIEGLALAIRNSLLWHC